MTASEVSLIYNAGSAGKCKVSESCIDLVTGPSTIDSISDANLTSWWPGDNTYSDIVDSNGGTPKGAVIVVANGIVGSAFDFDGFGTRIEVEDNTNIQNIFNGGATIEAWIFPNTIGEGNGGRIIEKRINCSIEYDELVN